MTALALSRWRKHSVLPGFGLTLGITVTMLSLIVLFPLLTLFFASAGMGWDKFVAAAFSPRAMAAYELSFGAAAGAAAINAVFGLLVAWVLVRYQFPGKRIFDGFVDLPFALPTAVAGIALTALYAQNGWIGSTLSIFGLNVAFTPMGIVVVLIFEGLPFVVRTVQPVLEDLDKEVEEASASLGADRWQTLSRVVLPAVTPALLTGTTLAFARGLGEYGSVIFIAGNMPFVSEIAPLLIIIHLEEYAYGAAAAVATVMLIASFILLLLINLLQRWSRNRYSAG